MDFLKSAVASAIAKGPLAAYSVQETVDLEHSIWTLNNAIRREGNQRCSVFTFDVSPNKNRISLAQNAARKFRTLRHPGVIHLLETIETDTHIYIITERVQPLATYLRHNSTSEDTIRWGAWNIAKTVKFINNDAAAVHCILRLSSVFSAENGEWKLGGFELLSSTKEEDNSLLNTYSSVFPAYRDALPPEVGKSGWGAYRTTSWSAVDAYGYGSLLTELFGGSPPAPGRGPDTGNIPGDMQQVCKRLVNTNPKMRPSVSIVLDQGRRNGAYFHTPLIDFSENIDSLGLKSEGERDEFLRDLKDIAQNFPDEYLKRKLLPELLKSVEFGGGGPKVFSVVLEVGIKLSEEEYEAQLTPVLVRLFSSPDRALRLCLLESLPEMIDHLSQKIVNDRIFPNLVTGFTDLAPLVREQTVKSVLTIIPKLSDRTINGDLLKYLAKTSNDAEAGIRTNTTVCLGKIAKYIAPSTRTKVLIAAFTRSLRDPFVPARSSALMALGATVDMFSEDDCANKVLPAICPSLVDKEKIVRDQANRALDVYLQRVRKFSQTLPDTVQPPPPQAQSPALNGSSRPSTATAVSSESSWTGWALSSFASKFATPEVGEQIEAKPNGTSAPAPTIVLRPTALPTNATRPAVMNRNVSETTHIVRSFVDPEVAEDDGWGAMDDTNDTGEGEGEAEDAWGGEADGWGETPSTASKIGTAVRSGTATSSSSRPTTSKSKFDDNGEPDFAGWLKAQSQSKKPASALPKGLAPKSGVRAASPSASIGAKPPAIVRTPSAVVRKAVIGAGTTTAKPAVAAPKKETAAQQNDDEAWGDAWD